MINKFRTFLGTTLFSTIMFSYASTSSRNMELVESLLRSNVIKSEEVSRVMKAVDRGDYAQHDPYNDWAQSIGYQATISAPHMHAYALEYLKEHLKNGRKVLDVGSGSGYLTVCFAKMMETPGSIAYGIEHIPELVKESKENIQKHDRELLESGKIIITEGDGRFGLSKHGPFDAIHVGASASEIPKALIDQLANGGRMLIPVGSSRSQDFLVIDKDESGNIVKKKTLDVMYIPLTDKEEQIRRRF